MVRIAPPPPVVPPNPKWFTAEAGTRFVRMYDPAQFSATPVGFRRHGPHKRFDHHNEGIPAQDADHSILYAGKTFSGCLLEIFGDTKIVKCGKWEIVVFEIERELSLLDLRGDGALRAGSVAALCKDSVHSLSQKWSRYFYQNPFLYSEIDGLIFGNAHNDELALVLYERCKSSLRLIINIPLASKNLRYSLLKIASDLGFVIEPERGS
ncbi:RES family NAD+ phosphorylase [bacterium]|nr:RES family NAD+ phosphorylase [bacterium]MBP9809916.1 RES family NAD+ phosphorylase [bacterium]